MMPPTPTHVCILQSTQNGQMLFFFVTPFFFCPV